MLTTSRSAAVLKQHTVMAIEHVYGNIQADSIMIICFGNVCFREFSCVQGDFAPTFAGELYLECNHDAYQ